MELLEYRDQSVYVVRTVYRELHRLVLPHDTTKSRIIPQILEHAEGEYGEKAGHRFKSQCDRINFVHRIYEPNCFTADRKLLKHVIQLFLGLLLSLLLG